MGKTEEGHKHLGLSALGFPAWRRFFSLLFFFEACPIPLYMIFFFFFTSLGKLLYFTNILSQLRTYY